MLKKLLFILAFLSISLNLAAQTGSRAYVGGGYGTGVDVIDVENMTVLRSIANAGGYRLVLSLDGKKLYSTAGDGSIYISDTSADTLIKSFDPSQGAFDSGELEGITISPDGSKVYVVDEWTSAVFVIDTSADTVLSAGTLDTDESENVVCSPDGQFIYVNDNTWTSKFSTTTFECLGFVDTGSDGHGIAISRDGSKIYAEGPGVIVIDSATMTAVDTLNAGGYYLETSFDGARVYGVNESNQLSVIDANNDTLISKVTLSTWGAAGVTSDQSGNFIFVAGWNKFLKLDANSLTEIGEVASRYRSIALLEPNATVPIELASFTAAQAGHQIFLSWRTLTETQNYGFEIQRKVVANWQTIAFVAGNGSTLQPHAYEFVDELSEVLSALPEIRYRLKQLDFDGSFTYSPTVTVDLSLPETAQLLQNFPNPFNPVTTIVYNLTKASHTTLKVFDLLGREVAVLVDEFKAPGKYAVEFNGEGLTSGLYVYRLKAGRVQQMKKFILLK